MPDTPFAVIARENCIGETTAREIYVRALEALAIQLHITADLLGYNTPEDYLASGDNRIVRLREDPEDNTRLIAQIYRVHPADS